MMKREYGDKDLSLSAIGGVETGNDAAEFILLGANTVQVRRQQILIFFLYELKNGCSKLKIAPFTLCLGIFSCLSSPLNL